VPVHHDRSRVHEARFAGLAIMLSVAALILVVVYVVGDYTHKVVVEFVVPSSAPATGSAIAPGLALGWFRPLGEKPRPDVRRAASGRRVEPGERSG
jgi:hypothetical protein